MEKYYFNPDECRKGTMMHNTYLLLEAYPDLRDSDKKLLMAYYNVYLNMEEVVNNSKNPFRTFCDFLYQKKTPTPVSVVRCRAKIQEAGYFIGTRREEKLKIAEKMSDWSINSDEYDDIPIKN